MGARMAVWDGRNHDEIAALAWPAGDFPPSIAFEDGRLFIDNVGEVREVMPGDVVSRGALGELHVFSTVAADEAVA